MRHNEPPRRKVPRRAAMAASGLLSVVVLTAGCSHGTQSPGVATVGSSTAPASEIAMASTPTGSAKADPLGYSKCMRAHGITDFPDPNSQGQVTINLNGHGSDLDPSNPANKAAAAACKQSDLHGKSDQAKQDQLKATGLKYAQCMRSHGITDFPDPDADGGIQVTASPGSDLEPDNPQNKSATTACEQYQP
ncbi:MAG: hypothetical protein QOH29_163 [Actinomycetota bacterium]|nr:hypothetical protein [Actinomycetota bacterium]